MNEITARVLTVALALGLGACNSAPPVRSTAADMAVEDGSGCSTATVRIAFDFDGASASRCVIRGERSFAIVISPEHAPPINPSPWYAFRYEAKGGGPVSVRLDYLWSKHRYTPKLAVDGGGTRELAATVAEDGRSASFDLPAGSGMVSAQPMVGAARYRDLVGRLSASPIGRHVALGRSLDGRPIDGVLLGDPSATRLLVLLGRQHPPEVTGSYALVPFVETIEARLRASPELAHEFQVLIVPLLNPDGVARGHWRANRGGGDLNRDWGSFSQPETRAVRNWLGTLDPAVHAAMMIDFHSTRHSLFYVQGEEASTAQQDFLDQWLGGREKSYPGYPFTIERRNANPGSGTSKNWFHATYGIPAYTYEVGDEADPQGTAEAARDLAARLLDILAASD